MRYLTKSRYKIAKECPQKLYYTSKKEYYNAKLEDDFLAMLAEGGFQVGELAKYYYPGGVLIETLDTEKALADTNKLLEQEEAVIYEAAFLYEKLFIRADVIIKKGDKLKLIEVKAKSIDGADENLLTKKGSVKAAWAPYLDDVAFQKFVISRAWPQFKIASFLLLADKSSLTTVDGLNQLFFINSRGDRPRVEVSTNITPAILGEKILCEVRVDDIINLIHKNTTPYGSFEDEVSHFAECYWKDQPAGPKIGARCGKCEFRIADPATSPEQKSGFHECWTAAGLTMKQLNDPLVLELWNFRRKEEYISRGTYFLHEFTVADFVPAKNAKPVPYLPQLARQELQVQKAREENPSHYIDREGLSLEMNEWVYPLHFIDFETTAVAIPFNAGMRPYEQVAFQFSHHIMRLDGSVEHVGEWINVHPGKFPNFDFIRALKKELENDQGCVFRYAAHENTILNVIHRQLMESNEPDRVQLCEWIETITHSSSSSAKTWRGDRDMIDLLDLVLKYYYNPLTRGSNSIKHVLPAILSTSRFLQEKYSKPVYGTAIKSKNFDGQCWITRDEAGSVINPYKTLPCVYDGVDNDLLDQFIIDDATGIADGGAAMIAYARMQFSQMTEKERQKIVQALKRYCELDTMAMVMIVEAWKDWCS
ncbi:MAG: DUF2779 domain-containing protein [Ginsengibacter sp.]